MDGSEAPGSTQRPVQVVDVPDSSHRAAVVAGFSGWLLDAFDFFLVTFCLTAIARDFHKSDAEIALVITMTLAFRPVGGFVFGKTDDPAFRELFIRWFQYATFNPILRVHGTRQPDENELWSYGPDAQKILVNFDRLRYRMLPYIYSLAWKTTSESYTPMRPLVMDFRSDPRAGDIGDQFMYGPAFLVNPVTEPASTSRQLYLPNTKWYDFWSGAEVAGGHMINTNTSIDRIPVYVRAGSIVPLGPDQEWSTEKTEDPIELRVYPGADADFTLYEDENDTYNYEKGESELTHLHWSEAAGKLTRSGADLDVVSEQGLVEVVGGPRSARMN